jgi:hypothetical protein
MADPISPEVLKQAQAATSGIKPAAKPAAAPVFDIAAEARAAAHKSTTLTPEQTKEYEKAMTLYEKAGDRLGSPTWSAQDARNLKAFTNELERIDKMPEADRTAVLGRMMYHGAHMGGQKGTGLLADITLHAPSSRDILFTDQKGKNVPFPKLLEEGINVNTSDVRTTAYDVQPDPNLWSGVQQQAARAHQLEVKDAKAAHQR